MKPSHRIIKEEDDKHIIYMIYGFNQDFDQNMKALFSSLDEFFPVTGVKAIIERKHLRTKNHNLHIG